MRLGLESSASASLVSQVAEKLQAPERGAPLLENRIPPPQREGWKARAKVWTASTQCGTACD